MSDQADEPREDETAADPGEAADHAGDPALPVFHRYLGARRRGDDEAASRHWNELIVMSYPLMRNRVARRVGRPGLAWLAEGDIDDVAQDAYVRAQGMARTFNGEALGQARAALLTTAQHTALDANRRQGVRRREVAGSLDEQGDHEDGGTGEWLEAVAGGGEDWTERSALAAVEYEETVEAIGRIPSEDQRHVLALTWQGYTSGEIAEMMGKSANNVDKLRERGLKALRGILGHD